MQVSCQSFALLSEVKYFFLRSNHLNKITRLISGHAFLVINVLQCSTFCWPLFWISSLRSQQLALSLISWFAPPFFPPRISPKSSFSDPSHQLPLSTLPAWNILTFQWTWSNQFHYYLFLALDQNVTLGDGSVVYPLSHDPKTMEIISLFVSLFENYSIEWRFEYNSVSVLLEVRILSKGNENRKGFCS